MGMLCCTTAYAQTASSIDLFGIRVELPAAPPAAGFNATLSEETIRQYLASIDPQAYQPFLDELLRYKAEHKPDDWLYYQAIRKMAQYISPKADNYYRYTFFKWWLLTQSGYKALLTYSHPYLLFYVRSDEVIYNIPCRTQNGEQYICLNYHDYGSIDFDKTNFTALEWTAAGGRVTFSYKVTALPDFNEADYAEKDVHYSDGLNQYSFRIKVNPQLKPLFKNYPVVGYDLQFNMPLSRITYESLIPSLKKQVQGMKQRDGVAFLMRFTRYAFLFRPDGETFGTEKRLTPEETLLYEYSDCEDRAALFFLLVKEIYDLPMLVLTYPRHVTVAVQFDKAYGQTIVFNGMKYSICEPSPQRVDLPVGALLPELRRQSYQVAYAYQPSRNK